MLTLSFVDFDPSPTCGSVSNSSADDPLADLCAALTRPPVVRAIWLCSAVQPSEAPGFARDSQAQPVL